MLCCILVCITNGSGVIADDVGSWGGILKGICSGGAPKLDCEIGGADVVVAAAGSGG